MPQLITLSKLAALVNENTGIDIALCEAFIRNMAQTAAGGLIEGEHIRIKDFGLFELRRPVDGAATVEFIPESAFAEGVNAPFAHLRATEVPKHQPSVGMESHQQQTMPHAPSYRQHSQSPRPAQFPRQPEAPTYTQQQPEIPQPAPFTRQPEAPAYTQLPPEMPQPAPIPRQPEAPTYAQQLPEMPQHAPFTRQPEAPAYTQLPPEMPQPAPIPRQPEAPTYTQQQPEMPQPAPFTRQPEAPAYTQLPPEMPQTAPIPRQPETPAFADQHPDFTHTPEIHTQQPEATPDLPSYLNLPGLGQKEADPDTVSPATPLSSQSSHPIGYNRQLPQISTNKKYVLIGVLGLIVGFVLGYLTARCTSGDPQDMTPTEEAATDTHADTTTPPVKQEYDYESALSVANTDSILEEEEETPDTPEEKAVAQTETVRLQKGQRLSDIALKHYGKKEYWVYIYLENRETISNPFAVREGATLRIPPKDKYAPTTDEATNLAWAKSKAAEINSKYIH